MFIIFISSLIIFFIEIRDNGEKKGVDLTCQLVVNIYILTNNDALQQYSKN